MVALEFNKCCWSIDLRVRCLIIGYLNLVVEIIVIVLGFTGIAAGGVVVAIADGKDKEKYAIGSAIMSVSIIILVVFAVFLALTIVLLVGVHQHKRGHIKAYLIGTVIFLALYLIAILASIGSSTASEVVLRIINFAINIYFLLCIRSYYYKMDDKPYYAAGMI